jgi:predicted GIY-YIG superfamily endonuclease
MTCGIYLITNTVNNKSYVGQSINIEKRWQQHKKSNETKPLYRAFKKHGIDKFIFEILIECKPEELDQNEIQCIAEYESYGDNGYNMTMGGKGARYDPDVERQRDPADKPSKAIAALKARKYEDSVWELLLHEYTCVKTGDDEHRLGSGSIPALLKALADLHKGKSGNPEDEQIISEMEEWSKK